MLFRAGLKRQMSLGYEDTSGSIWFRDDY